MYREVSTLQLNAGHYLRMLHCATDQAMTGALAAMDLTAAQGQIMGFIMHREQPPCARDIEEVFYLSHPTVSGILAWLEKKGFIEFRPDESDRRCKRIHALPKGKELDETMRNTILTTEAALVQDFTEEEKELFARLLNRAIRNVGMNPLKRKHKEESD